MSSRPVSPQKSLGRSDKMNILIVLPDSYPVGMACTNRIHLYARGLIECGHDVKIMIPKPFEKPGAINNPDRKGVYEGVPFEYSWHTPIRSSNFIVRRIHDLISPIFAVWKALLGRHEAILIVSNSISIIFPFKVVSLLTGSLLLQEKSELPFYMQEQLTKVQKLYVKYIYRLFSGIIVISDPLRSYFEGKINKGARLLKVPILVDVDGVYAPEIRRLSKIVYTGPLTQHKDGVLTILESFTKIANEYPDYDLELTGDLASSPIRKEIEVILDESELEGRIHFLGFLGRKEMLQLLNEAAVLLLAKPENRQTTACFPTKLGEYLATGNPVLVTNVGEIPKFLTDGENAFFAEPTTDSFSVRLRDVLNNRELSKKTGLHGQEAARHCFDYSNQGKCISEFIELLIKDKQSRQR